MPKQHRQHLAAFAFLICWNALLKVDSFSPTLCRTSRSFALATADEKNENIPAPLDAEQDTLKATPSPNSPQQIQKQETSNESFDFDTFLDTPFFDPNDENLPPFLQPLANFVRQDYPTAELVMSGTFIAFMIVVSQEMVRMQLYGDRYIPFSAGGSGLF